MINTRKKIPSTCYHQYGQQLQKRLKNHNPQYKEPPPDRVTPDRENRNGRASRSIRTSQALIYCYENILINGALNDKRHRGLCRILPGRRPCTGSDLDPGKRAIRGTESCL
jgi:hypothetical protein